ncbi:prolipoprotein diacylglyceryl transferase [Ornithinimicrobium sp. Arc0846-15]|nr:prolipoprotein diacylglyceryl transferase [Ornithinimicrobium laminariae]
MSLPLAIPSPDQAVWMLGPFPIRAYAFCILLGIVAAIVITNRRLIARGGTGEEIYDIAPWAIAFGIIGGRIYHVISSPRPYFGESGNLVDAFKIWEGGLGIWGAISLGAVGAYIGARRHGHSFGDLADALAPGLLVAQAMGRWGNWFNNELYGGASDAPWALTIHEWDAGSGRAVVDAAGDPVVLGTFQPTFLYESLWCIVVAVGLVLLDRRVRLARGQVFSLYMMGYTAGRLVIELMRTDPAEIIFGQRINVWVSIGVFLIGLALFLWQGRRGDYPQRGYRSSNDPSTVETAKS